MARRQRTSRRPCPRSLGQTPFSRCRVLRVEPLEARLCLSAAQIVAHWTFDNDDVTGDTIADTSPIDGSQDGAKTNGGPATGIDGVVGEAADFAGGANNGNHQYADLGIHAGTFGTLATGTISAWVKPNVNGVGDPTDRLTMFSVSNSGAPSEEMTFAIDNGANAGKLSYIVRDGATLGNVTSSSSDLLDGLWHHVAVTVGFGNATRIYIDGDHQGNATVPFLNALVVDSAAIGRNRDSNPGGGQWFFGGQMDDVGLWDNALTGAEIKALVSLAQHPQLNYDLAQAETLFNLSDAESGSVVVGGRTWTAAAGLSSDAGVIVADDSGALSLLLDGDNGVGVRSEAVPFVVTSTADVGPGSLRAMIDQANSVPGADTITFDASVNGGTVLMNLGQMTIADAVTIDATSLAGGFTLDAQLQSRIFNIDDGGVANDFDVTLAALTLTRGHHSGGGGAIRSVTTGDLTMNDLTISDSHSVAVGAHGGGGIFVAGDILLTGSTLSGNTTNGLGGGIDSMGNVTLSDSTISGNMANGPGGGLYTTGHATLTGSTIDGNTSNGNGGGIFARGRVTLNQTTVSGNSATTSQGGGLLAVGGAVVNQTTISGNTAAGAGGGMYSDVGDVTLTESTVSGNSSGAFGGGIATPGNVTLTESTVSGNSADGNGGGIAMRFSAFSPDSEITLVRSTISGNSSGNAGGGVYSYYGDIVLDGSIVAGNTADSVGQDISAILGGIDANYSLIGDTADLTQPQLDAINAGTGNTLDVDPRLGPLADNGGPTLTHTLRADSPAIDAGDPNFTPPPDFDQRGAPFVRVFDGDDDSVATIDMGAVEVQFLTLVVDSTNDESDGDFSAGDFSLREAIEQSNSIPVPHVISFAASLSDETISLTPALGQITIADELTIDATDLDVPLTIDAQEQSRIFDITGGASNVTIKGLTLTGGQITGTNPTSNDFDFSGGAIRSFAGGTLTIENSTITDNHATGLGTGGGGIFVLNDLTLIDSTISGNSAQTYGGGFQSRGDATVLRSRISGNSASEGGGIRTRQDLMIVASTLSGNSAENVGGGGAASGDASVIQSTISGNTVTSRGGGLAAAGIMTVRDSTVTDNSAFDTGGVLSSTETRLYGSIVAGNTATFLSPDVNHVVIAEHSLIGNDHGAHITDNGGNIIGTSEAPIDPLLGPLADNGGPTMTHALLAGSPAIDAGDPAAAAGMDGVPAFDQRGAPYGRVADGNAPESIAIDIGAYEAQGIPEAMPGDYNRNGVVDAADYTVWRDALGGSGLVPLSGADGDGNGAIDDVDYRVWKSHFGAVQPVSAAGGGAVVGAVELPSARVVAVVGDGALLADSMAGAAAHVAMLSRPWADSENVGRARRAPAADDLSLTSESVDLLMAVIDGTSSKTAPEDPISFSAEEDEPDVFGDAQSPTAVDMALSAYAGPSDGLLAGRIRAGRL